MKKYNFKITIQYDGSRYKGWQVQKNEENTIQGKFQNILSSLAGEMVEVIGSGRTDAGVHAEGQVANFHLTEEELRRMSEAAVKMDPGPAADLVLCYLNHYLPEDIAVIACEEVPDRFHSRYSCLSKTYRYRIHTSEIPNVFERKYMYTYTDFSLNLSAMEEAARSLVGTHDYASFCGNKHMKKSTVRTIFSIDLTKDGDDLIIDYTGDGFLQNMVRILTGTLIEVGSGRRAADSMPALLAAKDRQQAGYTAPAQGLTLREVRYGNP